MLSAAGRTAAGLAAAAAALRAGAGLLPGGAGVSFPLLPATPAEAAAHLAAAGGVAAAVFLARGACNRRFPALRASSDAANGVVLPGLSTADVLAVSLLSGCSEELFFRGALMPAVAPDARGCCVAAAVFGALHLTGGRAPAVAAWAAGVGAAYGALALATGDAAAAAAAHAACNFASGVAWKRRNQGPPAGEGGAQT